MLHKAQLTTTQQSTLEKIVSGIIVLDKQGNPVDILPYLQGEELTQLNIPLQDIHIIFTDKNFALHQALEVITNPVTDQYSTTVMLGDAPVTITMQGDLSFEDSNGKQIFLSEGEMSSDNAIQHGVEVKHIDNLDTVSLELTQHSAVNTNQTALYFYNAILEASMQNLQALPSEPIPLNIQQSLAYNTATNEVLIESDAELALEAEFEFIENLEPIIVENNLRQESSLSTNSSLSTSISSLEKSQITADATVTAGIETQFNFSTDNFKDPSEKEITYTATQADGRALDSWIVFDNNNLSFSFDADLAAIGHYSIKVTTSDQDNLLNSDTFTVNITAPIVCEGTDKDDHDILSSKDDLHYAFAGNDNIDGSAGNDIIYGGSGNDFLTGGSGDDQLYGGHDNDTLIYDSKDSVINGGLGFDTLQLNASDNLNLNIIGKVLHNIEHIDLGHCTVNTLSLTVADVLQANSQQLLFIQGDANDSVILDRGWTATHNTDNTTVSGVTFNEYSNGNALLYLDQDILSVI
jgi:Ca2+-binding RTX toxin-like protein